MARNLYAAALLLFGIGCTSAGSGAEPTRTDAGSGRADRAAGGKALQDSAAEGLVDGGPPDGNCIGDPDAGPALQIDGGFSTNDDAQVLPSSWYGVPTPYAAPFAIFDGPDGNVWFVESQAHRIAFITPCGAITEFDVAPAITTIGIALFGSDGLLWLSNANTDDLYRMTTSGSLTKLPVNEYIDSATLGGDGNLWLTNGRTIKFIGPTGTVNEISNTPPTGGGISELTKGPDGQVWFAIGSPASIGRVTPDGNWTIFPLPPTGYGLLHIVTGSDGNLWYTESSPDGVVGRMTPAGVVTEFTFGGLSGRLIVGADGNLWTIDMLKTNLMRVTTNGVITRFVIEPSQVAGLYIGTAIGQFTAGHDGYIWATEFVANAIIRFSIE